MLCRWALADKQKAKANRCSRAIAHLKRKLLLKSVLAWGQARCIEAETRHAFHEAQRFHQQALQVSHNYCSSFPPRANIACTAELLYFEGNPLSMVVCMCTVSQKKHVLDL